jgi:hypothetical protein
MAPCRKILSGEEEVQMNPSLMVLSVPEVRHHAGTSCQERKRYSTYESEPIPDAFISS